MIGLIAGHDHPERRNIVQAEELAQSPWDLGIDSWKARVREVAPDVIFSFSALPEDIRAGDIAPQGYRAYRPITTLRRSTGIAMQCCLSPAYCHSSKLATAEA